MADALPRWKSRAPYEARCDFDGVEGVLSVGSGSRLKLDWKSMPERLGMNLSPMMRCRFRLGLADGVCSRERSNLWSARLKACGSMGSEAASRALCGSRISCDRFRLSVGGVLVSAGEMSCGVVERMSLCLAAASPVPSWAEEAMSAPRSKEQRTRRTASTDTVKNESRV
jgi:hypothetical protein